MLLSHRMWQLPNLFMSMCCAMFGCSFLWQHLNVSNWREFVDRLCEVGSYFRVSLPNRLPNCVPLSLYGDPYQLLEGVTLQDHFQSIQVQLPDEPLLFNPLSCPEDFMNPHPSSCCLSTLFGCLAIGQRMFACAPSSPALHLTPGASAMLNTSSVKAALHTFLTDQKLLYHINMHSLELKVANAVSCCSGLWRTEKTGTQKKKKLLTTENIALKFVKSKD